MQELLGTYALAALLSTCCFELSDVDMLTKERYISQALHQNFPHQLRAATISNISKIERHFQGLFLERNAFNPVTTAQQTFKPSKNV
jgi:hypothetical protein